MTETTMIQWYISKAEQCSFHILLIVRASGVVLIRQNSGLYYQLLVAPTSGYNAAIAACFKTTIVSNSAAAGVLSALVLETSGAADVDTSIVGRNAAAGVVSAFALKSSGAADVESCIVGLSSTTGVVIALALKPSSAANVEARIVIATA